MQFEGLYQQLRQDAECFRANHYVKEAQIIERCIERVVQEVHNWHSELLPAGVAAKYSGYTTCHLGRLAKTGKLQNFGTRFRPKYRRGALPRRRPIGDVGVALSEARSDRSEEVLRDILASKVARN